jgi:uncharacterized protein (TIGR00369 family)
MSLLDDLKAARAADDLGPLVTSIPFARFLQLSVGRVDGELRVVMPFAEQLVGNPSVPALHGGAVASLLESAAISVVLAEQEPMILPRPVTLTFDYLRPARPAELVATATILRRGRRICTVRAIAWQEDRDRPVATANATLLLT